MRTVEGERVAVAVAGNRLIRAIFRNENVFVEAELRSDALQQTRHVQSLLVYLQFESVHALGQAGKTIAQNALLASKLDELCRHGCACRLGGRQLHPRRADRTIHRIQHRGQLAGDPGGDVALSPAENGPPRRLSGCIPLALALTLQLHDPRLAGAHPLLEGLDVEACAHLAVAGRLDFREHAVAGRCVQDRSRRLARDREPLLRDARRLFGLVDRRRSLLETGGEAIAVGDRRFVSHGGPIDLLGVRGKRRVVRAQGREGGLGALAAGLECVDSVREGFAQRIGHDGDLVAALCGRIPVGRQLQTRAPLS